MNNIFQDFESSIEKQIPSGGAIQQEQINADQQTFEWFKQRCGRFTGSKFPDLMKRGRKVTDHFGEVAKKLIRKTAMERMMSDDGLEIYIREQMAKDFRQTRWGNEYEPEARQKYAEKTGQIVIETKFEIHHDYDFIGGSFDGEILNHERGIIEIKCPYNPEVHAENRDLMLSGVLTEKHTYYDQIQANIGIAGVEWCDFISYDPRLKEEHQLVIIRVPRDQSRIDQIIERAIIANKVANMYVDGVSIDEGLKIVCSE